MYFDGEGGVHTVLMGWDELDMGFNSPGWGYAMGRWECTLSRRVEFCSGLGLIWDEHERWMDH